MEEKKRFLILDGNAILHRSFHALPPLKTKNGELVNAVYGFLLVLLKTIRELEPSFAAVTFDLPAPTFRHKRFEDYKATRPKTPEQLYKQLPRLKELLQAFRIPVFEKEGFEADDIIGTLAKKIKKTQIFPRIESVIVSGDSDNLQLINAQTKVYTLKKGVKETLLYDHEWFLKRYQGVTPSQVPDLKALTGDPSDNIPGVPGIGEKTAINILLEFGSIESLYKELETHSLKTKKLKPKIKELLSNSRDQVFFSKMLATIKTDVPISFVLKDCELGAYEKEKIAKLFQELEFYSLIPRLEKL